MTTEIGVRVVQIRGQLSQAAFADKIGVHKNTLGGYERGEREPGADFLHKLMVAGYNANWVLTGQGPMLLKDLEGAATHEVRSVSNTIDQQLDQIEKTLTLQKAPITPELLAQSPELQRLQEALSVMVEDKSLSARQHTRASFLLHIAFGTPHTELAKAHRRETQARYHDALKDFEEAVKLVDYRPPEPVQEGFKIAMFAHGLTKEGAIILLRFLKMSGESSGYF